MRAAVAVALVALLALAGCGERDQADDAAVHRDIVSGTGNVEVTFDATITRGPSAVGGFVQRGIAAAADETSVVEMGGVGAETQETRATEASVRGFWKAYRMHMGL